MPIKVCVSKKLHNIVPRGGWRVPNRGGGEGGMNDLVLIHVSHTIKGPVWLYSTTHTELLSHVTE